MHHRALHVPVTRLGQRVNQADVSNRAPYSQCRVKGWDMSMS
jgi:hypothetical protein